LKLIKKMVGAGYKLLGMPYNIVKYVLGFIYKILKEIPNYITKGIDYIIKVIKSLFTAIWKPFPIIAKLLTKPFIFVWKLIKMIKPKAIAKWLYDVLKESVAQIFTLLGFYIAWFTLTGTAQDIVGIAIIISTVIWLLTIRWREDG